MSSRPAKKEGRKEKKGGREGGREQKKARGWWRDDSAIKNTGYSFRGPGFKSQHLHGSSQKSVIPGQAI